MYPKNHDTLMKTSKFLVSVPVCPSLGLKKAAKPRVALNAKERNARRCLKLKVWM